MGEQLRCPHCGRLLDRYDQPRLTVDAVVMNDAGEVLLINRRNPPLGWALPGGFVDVGETLEAAVARELTEETGLRARSVRQFHTYSDPHRDPRHHTISTVFQVEAEGDLIASDDALDAAYFSPFALPKSLVFDHSRIIADIIRHPTQGG
jgi:ADP-ribose pyrophosphatase YjhB (NUDIX family)